MKEKIHEQLSALVDNELQDAEQGMLFRQLSADGALREQLARYQLVSDSLQNHLPPQVDTGFHQRIATALQDEPALHVAIPRSRGLFKPLAGLAVAASVAVVAVFSLQSVREDAGVPVAAVASAPVEQDYLRADPGILPVASARAPQSLDAYLVNHNEYAANRGMLPYVRLVGHEMNVNGK